MHVSQEDTNNDIHNTQTKGNNNQTHRHSTVPELQDTDMKCRFISCYNS